MPDRDIPRIEEVARTLHKLRRDSLTGKGRPPNLLKIEWEDLDQSEKDTYYEEISEIVLALERSGFIVDLADRYHILRKKTNPLRVARTQNGRITFLGGEK